MLRLPEGCSNPYLDRVSYLETRLVMKTAIGRVRLVGLLEGVSFLLLLGVAMPLKYLAGRPEAVLAVGWAHGVLFVLFAAVVASALVVRQISLGTAAAAAVASVLPAGTFVLDYHLRKLDPTKAHPEQGMGPGTMS
jgi:integral membrane protein